LSPQNCVKIYPEHGAPVGEPPGPAAGSHSLVQYPSGRVPGTALSAVNKAARETLPASITTSFQGTAQAFQSSMQGLGLLLLAATLVIYIVTRHPVRELHSPAHDPVSAAVRGLRRPGDAHIFGSDLNVYAFVGIILLVGLVKKNGIMMIDFALDAQRREAATARDAIFKHASSGSVPS